MSVVCCHHPSLAHHQDSLTSTLYHPWVLVVKVACHWPPVGHCSVVTRTICTHVHYIVVRENLVIDARREGALQTERGTKERKRERGETAWIFFAVVNTSNHSSHPSKSESNKGSCSFIQ